jgi:hypothetical protein
MTRICLLTVTLFLFAASLIFSQQPEIRNLKRSKGQEIDKQKFTTFGGHFYKPIVAGIVTIFDK